MRAAFYLGLALAVQAFPAGAECPLMKAVYAPVDPEDDMSADAGKQNSYVLRHVGKNAAMNQADYMVRIIEEKQKISYDFAIAFTNGYGGTKLVFLGDSQHSDKPKLKDDDPGSSIQYFDAKLHTTSPEESKDGTAPHYLLMQELGGSLWYWTKGQRKFVPPHGMWAIARCEQ